VFGAENGAALSTKEWECFVASRGPTTSEGDGSRPPGGPEHASDHSTVCAYPFEKCSVDKQRTRDTANAFEIPTKVLKTTDTVAHNIK
jgi:hypothetical protein